MPQPADHAALSAVEQALVRALVRVLVRELRSEAREPCVDQDDADRDRAIGGGAEAR